jgi:hypothetical protein
MRSRHLALRRLSNGQEIFSPANRNNKAQVLAIVGKRPTWDKMQDGIETLQWVAGSHYAKFKNGRLIDYGTE